MAGRLVSSDGLVARDAAGQLGVGAGAQHDHAAGPPGAGQRVAEALGHGQHGHEHADHAGDADDDHQRGAEPRGGTFRRLISVIWATWFSQAMRSAVPGQRVDDAQAPHAQRGRQADDDGQPEGERRRPAATCSAAMNSGGKRPPVAPLSTGMQR